MEKPTYIESEQIYRATHLIRGVEVSIAALDVLQDDSGSNFPSLSPWNYYSNLEIGSHNLRAEALELRLAIELDRHRPRHFLPLIKHLQKYGADVELVQRAMKAKAIADDKMTKVLSQIRAKPYSQPSI